MSTDDTKLATYSRGPDPREVAARLKEEIKGRTVIAHRAEIDALTDYIHTSFICDMFYDVYDLYPEIIANLFPKSREGLMNFDHYNEERVDMVPSKLAEFYLLLASESSEEIARKIISDIIEKGISIPPMPRDWHGYVRVTDDFWDNEHIREEISKAIARVPEYRRKAWESLSGALIVKILSTSSSAVSPVKSIRDSVSEEIHSTGSEGA